MKIYDELLGYLQNGRWVVVYIFIVFLLSLLTSCNDEETISVSLWEEASIEVVTIDTFSVQLSTMVVDSFPTNWGNTVLVGRVEDEYSGILYSQGFLKIGYGSVPNVDLKNVVYDSVTLVLVYQSAYYDTLVEQKVLVHQLMEDIEPDEDGNLFGTDHFQGGIFLGEKVFYPKPQKDTVLEIRLNDDFGKDLFGNILGEVWTDLGDFEKYIKGMVLSPDPSQSAAILAFSTTSNINIYYTQKNILPIVSNSFAIPFNTTDSYFSKIEISNPAIDIRKNIGLKEIPSDSTGNYSLLMPGMGMFPIIKFPYLETLTHFMDSHLIVDANLIVKPVKRTYASDCPLPNALYLFLKDDFEYIRTYDGPYALTTYDEVFQLETMYKIPIRSFITNQLTQGEINPYSIILSDNNNMYSSAANRLVIGDMLHQNQLLLQIKYLKIK